MLYAVQTPLDSHLVFNFLVFSVDMLSYRMLEVESIILEPLDENDDHRLNVVTVTSPNKVPFMTQECLRNCQFA